MKSTNMADRLITPNNPLCQQRWLAIPDHGPDKPVRQSGHCPAQPESPARSPSGTWPIDKNAHKKGFTLAEVIIAIAIIGIITAIAIPNILSWLPNIRLKSAARDLYSNMHNAKMEAIKRNQNVVIAINTVDCTLSKNIPHGGGYQIFVDNNHKNNSKDINEPIISDIKMTNDIAICSESFSGTTAGFLPNGLLIANNAGSIEIKNKKNITFRLSLSTAGRIALKKL